MARDGKARRIGERERAEAVRRIGEDELPQIVAERIEWDAERRKIIRDE